MIDQGQAVPCKIQTNSPYSSLHYQSGDNQNESHCAVPLFPYPTRRQDCQDGSQPGLLGSIKLCPFPSASTFNLHSTPETPSMSPLGLMTIVQIPQTLTQFSEYSLYSLALQGDLSLPENSFASNTMKYASFSS